MIAFGARRGLRYRAWVVLAVGNIVIALLRAVGYPFLRHQSVLGVVVWIVVLLLVSGVVYVVVGSFRNRNARERDEPYP